MAEQAIPFRNVRADATRAIDEVKAEAEGLIEALDFQKMGQKVEDFGRKNPTALALAALTIGMAAGMMIKRRVSR